MENAARTTRYCQEIERRRASLRDQFAEIFPTGRMFVWEVGCGHGHFLTAYAQAHPEKLCVGIDLVAERIERAARKKNRAKLPNLFFVRAEARLFLETQPDAARASEVFILFPDPWPKLRHHKHRILQASFLSALAARAAEDCRVYFRTDFQPYFERSRDVLASHADWQLCDDPWPFEFVTVFQSRASQHYSLIARKRSRP